MIDETGGIQYGIMEAHPSASQRQPAWTWAWRRSASCSHLRILYPGRSVSSSSWPDGGVAHALKPLHPRWCTGKSRRRGGTERRPSNGKVFSCGINSASFYEPNGHCYFVSIAQKDTKRVLLMWSLLVECWIESEMGGRQSFGFFFCVGRPSAAPEAVQRKRNGKEGRKRKKKGKAFTCLFECVFMTCELRNTHSLGSHWG